MAAKADTIQFVITNLIKQARIKKAAAALQDGRFYGTRRMKMDAELMLKAASFLSEAYGGR
jgi:hypothetical protein